MVCSPTCSLVTCVESTAEYHPRGNVAPWLHHVGVIPKKVLNLEAGVGGALPVCWMIGRSSELQSGKRSLAKATLLCCVAQDCEEAFVKVEVGGGALAFPTQPPRLIISASCPGSILLVHRHEGVCYNRLLSLRSQR